MTTPRPVRSTAAVIAFAFATLTVGCSNDDETSSSQTSEAGSEVASSLALFDEGAVHAIAVTFDEDDYDAMIDEFVETGEKGWIDATVTIDGATYEHVGLRLKGNSSLMGLRSSSGPPGLAAADADSPESLPWLIRLDHFVEGQRHQGYADVVVRSGSSTTSVEEALALDLLDMTPLASQDAISTTFSVNGGDAVLRLAIEHPDDDAWQEAHFPEQEGALYKAESTGDWSYRGEDPQAYTDVFDQEGGSSVADLTPLVDLLRFVDEADDATFAAELGERLDVESFATYLAMMDLLQNFDDIDGPGNNAYLWWDADTGVFTVVPWDMNLAFGAFGAGGPPAGFDPSQLPEGFEPPEGVELPEGFDPTQLPAGGVPGRENPLVTRFHAVAELEALYQERLAALRADLYVTGAATDALEARVETLRAAGVVDEATLEEEAASLQERVDEIATGG